MPFPEPTHPGHTFLGYRGVSKRHFFIDTNNKAIKYNPPPPAVAGATQLGAGVYVTTHLRDAQDYAQDSAWNYYCSKFKSKSKYQDDGEARDTFTKSKTWMQWGEIHAVFMPTAKFNSEKASIADFSHVNVDKMGDFVGANLLNYVSQNGGKISGVKSGLFEHIQIVIYPPHTASLFIKNITKEASDYLDREGGGNAQGGSA